MVPTENPATHAARRWRGYLKEILIAGGVFFAVFFIGSEMRLSKQRGGGGALPVATQAPNFQAYDAALRRPTTLADYRGKPVILTFWGTWCGTCRDELPALQALHQESAGRFHVVTVAHDPVRAVQRYRARNPRLSLPMLVDPPGRAHRAYRVTAVPTTVIVDAQGKIVHDFVGVADIGILRDHMEALTP